MHQNFQLVRRINDYCLACERERATAASFLALRTLRELHSFHRLRSHDKLNGFFRIKWKIFESTQQIPGLERSRHLCFSLLKWKMAAYKQQQCSISNMKNYLKKKKQRKYQQCMCFCMQCCLLQQRSREESLIWYALSKKCVFKWWKHIHKCLVIAKILPGYFHGSFARRL